jgi:hypothetical protein
MRLSAFKFLSIILSVFVAGYTIVGQEKDKRNDRRPETVPAAQPQVETNKSSDKTAYTYEFTQREFLISHIMIEHDQSGRGNVTFERRSETDPIVEPVELSKAAMNRIFALWSTLKFLDSTENYQASKNFAHLGTYRLGMNDGSRKRTAEFNWSSNKEAWELAMEYRRVADQAILIFNLNIAREMQPLNAPQLLKEMEILLSRNGLSDPQQLVPLLTELRTDEHIPLMARNHAERILKKIEKVN